MANMDRVHPELLARYERLVEYCWARSWYIGVTSATRSFQEQLSLYQSWKNGTGNYAANPIQRIGPSPLGDWSVQGSYHMIQADGYSHALDLHWQQCSPEDIQEAAELFGLLQTVPGENWHYQWWDTHGVFDPIISPPVARPSEEDEMTPVIHQPVKRDTEANTYDFTYLPADSTDSPVDGIKCNSVLLLRRRGGASRGVVVFFNGVPYSYEVPEDGRTLKVRVPTEGLCSVVGDVICEAREQWSRV